MKIYKLYEETNKGYKYIDSTQLEDEVIDYLENIVNVLEPNHKVLVIEHNTDLGDSPYYLYKGNYITSKVEWQIFKDNYEEKTRKRKLR